MVRLQDAVSGMSLNPYQRNIKTALKDIDLPAAWRGLVLQVLYRMVVANETCDIEEQNRFPDWEH